METPKPAKKSRKRNRVPISCVICRRRKVKCDKQKPQCSNCIKNNVQHLCEYLEPVWAKPQPSEISHNFKNNLIPNGIKSEDPFNQNNLNSNNNNNNNTAILANSNNNNNDRSISNNLLNNNSNNDEILQLRKELESFKNKLKTVENENQDLKRKMINTNNSNLKSLQNNDNDDILDLIVNSNILFMAQKGNHYNIPITYQISIFSWMFMVKNDLYLNDLWMKILKLRQHYEYYYNRRNPDKNLISHYKNYDNRLSKFKNSSQTSIISQDKRNEHTSKLKKFLEKGFNVDKSKKPLRCKSKSKNNSKSNLNSNEIEISSSFTNSIESNSNDQNQLPNVCPVTGVIGVCPMGNQILNSNSNANSNSNPNPNSNISTTNSIQHPSPAILSSQDSSKLLDTKHISSPLKNSITLNTKKKSNLNKCPVLSINEKSSYTKKLTDSVSDYQTITDLDEDEEDEEEDSDEILEESKVCPLMIGDAKALFKEKLSKMNISSLRESYHKNMVINNEVSNLRSKSSIASPSKDRTTPVIPSPLSTPMSEIKAEDTEKLINYVPIAMKPDSLSSRQNSLKRPLSANSDIGTPNSNKLKKLKTISPSAIKSLNYNNTKQVISVIEQYIPNKKVVCLLIDRFFDKLYVNMPFVDEITFRSKISLILKNCDGNQRIKLSSIGTLYCEEFLNLCLLIVMIRLSWLSLPEKILDGLTQNELTLMKPDNFVTFVLVDMVKEVFTSAKIMSKPSVIIFQVGLYLKIYSTLSPEDGFDTDDSYTRNTGNSNNNDKSPGTPTSSTSNINDLSGDLTNEAPNMNSPNFISMLVQLAFTIGLNRDPLNFKNFYPNPNDNDLTVSRLFKQRHLWRKLWYGLLFLTVEANLSLGDYKKGLPIEIDVDPSLGSTINHSWDCRLPGGIEQGVLEKSFENGKNLQKELCVVQNFRESISSYKWIYKGMKLLFEVDRSVTTFEIENIINKLNEIVCEKSKFGFGADLIFGDQEIVNPFRARNSSVWIKKYTNQIKISRLKVHLIVKNMIFTLNYLLFLNHEQKLSKFLGQKNISIEKIEKQRSYIEIFFENSLLSAIENFKLFMQFIDDSNKLFPNCGSELLIYPFLMILNHRSHEFLISLVLRVQKNSPVIMEILKKNKIDPKELQKKLFTYLETFIERLDGLTKSYYYAWVLKRLVKFFYNILANSQKFFKLNFKRMNVPQKMKSNIVVNNKNVNESTNDLKFENDDKNNGEKSAFQIAFGTSKLPPVTDFTHDDRREINFNNSIENSDSMFGNSPSLTFSMNNSNRVDMNTPTINSSMVNISNMNINNPQSNNHIMSNLIDDQSNASPNSPILNLNGLNSGINTNSSFGGELTEIFDDQFLNNIGGFAMENVNANGFLGFNNAFSSEIDIPTPNLHIPNSSNTPIENTIASNLLNVTNPNNNTNTNSVATDNITNNNSNTNYSNSMNTNTLNNTTNTNFNNINNGFNMMNTNDDLLSNAFMNNNNKNEMYNSLNEIDFTNVDLNSQVDNLVYGVNFNLQQDALNSGLRRGNSNMNNSVNNNNNNNNNNNSNNNNNNTSNNNETEPTLHLQNNALGHWDFF